MKIEKYKYPKSSFLSMEKDMAIIVDYIMRNDNLKKMLYYTTPDCLNKNPLSEDETLDLFGKNIKIVPKLYVDPTVLNYIVINFDNFATNLNNPEFRDNTIEFDIICHMDQWQMQDFELRPYRIAAELDTMFNKQHLTGIGRLDFVLAKKILLTEEYSGVCLIYKAIHGEEDKKFQPNPNNEQQAIENFNKVVYDK